MGKRTGHYFDEMNPQVWMPFSSLKIKQLLNSVFAGWRIIKRLLGVINLSF
jgi:hypothetical protein